MHKMDRNIFERFTFMSIQTGIAFFFHENKKRIRFTEYSSCSFPCNSNCGLELSGFKKRWRTTIKAVHTTCVLWVFWNYSFGWGTYCLGQGFSTLVVKVYFLAELSSNTKSNTLELIKVFRITRKLQVGEISGAKPENLWSGVSKQVSCRV